jgi:hypothetical protein
MRSRLGIWPLSLGSCLSTVMAGHVPAIHAFSLTEVKAWIPGTSPGMTHGGNRMSARASA